VDLVRDVLDKTVVDRNGRGMGRVDGILLDFAAGRPPTVSAVLIGPAALADRLHPVLGSIVRRLEKRAGLDDGRPARIAFAAVEDISRHVRVGVTVGETEVDAVEQRLRAGVARIPGSR